MQSAISAAKARQETILRKWANPTLTTLYEPMATVLAWNTIYTPYEGVVTPVSRGWDFGSGYVLFDWSATQALLRYRTRSFRLPTFRYPPPHPHTHLPICPLP